jgi:hypothetical protein
MLQGRDAFCFALLQIVKRLRTLAHGSQQGHMERVAEFMFCLALMPRDEVRNGEQLLVELVDVVNQRRFRLQAGNLETTALVEGQPDVHYLDFR